jgi:DNA-binding XRE family transcriptional regulator
MDAIKRQRLEAKGWKFGTAEEFLGLSPEEAAFVEIKLGLSKRLKELRVSHQLSQTALARRLNSSQSRVAKMEAGDPSVSTDLLIRALFSVGATSKDVAEAIASGESTKTKSASRSCAAQDR